ncbi:recombination protein O N-terminal domain-containing protein [Moraxella nasovis]|uniref:DNA repair protein RecO n=1 Tax=Moraxella nasovis TaxID=2904121 RepID=UPI001F60FD01|nr:recombination protein O N-terminal domain-containing protein [Moraxella nasovis]UNU74154.1 recombination protein O N-terminal domain-containing protein [Moraxella nasovis]
MRNEPLTAYVLHTRPYQEKRAIYQCFSQEFGMVHGVGMRGVPSFVPVRLFASGQTALKNFSQITIDSDKNSTLFPVRGQAQFALLYLNEILCKLLALENACPKLWQSYQDSINALQALSLSHLDDSNTLGMKCILRKFERALFDELGAMIDYDGDYLGETLAHNAYYQFIPNSGFTKVDTFKKNQSYFLGDTLKQMGKFGIKDEFLTEFGQIHRQLLDFLLDFKPLNSRKLWQAFYRYQH